MAKYANVDDYVASLAEAQATIVQELRAVVRRAVPEASEVLKWAQPVYEKRGPFAYIKAYARFVNLGFWRGAALPDPARIVRSGGKKMGHVRIATLDDIDSDAFTALLCYAADLNDRLGDPSKTR